MGFETNRVIDTRKIIDKQVVAYMKGKEYKKDHNSFKKVLEGVIKCSVCGRGMSKRFGRLQIENKRKNAPICIPCIEGRPRRPLNEVEDITAGWKQETKDRLKKINKEKKCSK